MKGLLSNHGVNHRFFAFQTANTGAGAAVDDPFQTIIVTVDAMQPEHRTLIRIARIG